MRMLAFKKDVMDIENRVIDPEVIQCMKKDAKHPLFCDVKKRLETFEFWPIEYFLPKKIVAAAGFFHIDKSTDKVTCWYCDLNLMNFEPMENILVLHTINNPICKYNNYIAGDKYVKEILSAKSPDDNFLMCKICYEEIIEIMLFPCRHAVTCSECTKRVRSCPLCRQPILKEEIIYLS